MSTQPSLAEEADAFLQAVYLGTSYNRFAYKRVFAPDTTNPSYQRLQRWARPLATGQPGIVLRRVVGSDGTDAYIWYGIARSERDLRRLGEELTAFVGPSVSDVSRERAALDASDPVEQAILDYSGGHAIRFQGDDGEMAKALDLLFQTRSRKHTRAPISTASPSLVLRRFHMALVAGVPSEADAALRELRERALLTPLNLHFLQVRRFEAFAQWESIVADTPSGDQVPLDHLLAVRRPRAVTEALLRAVYYRRLATHQADTDAFLVAFQSSVEAPFAALFTAPTGFHSVEALRSFMALAATTDDASLRDRVAELAKEAGLDDSLLNALAQRVTQNVPGLPSLDVAAHALLTNDFGRAFEVAVALPRSPDVARVLLQCAYEIQNAETKTAAIHAVEALYADQKSTLLSSRSARDFYDDIAGSQEEEPLVHPTSWTEWMQAILDGSLSHARAVELATTGSREWTVARLLHDGSVAQLAEAMQDAATMGEEAWRTVQPALPHLIGALQNDPHYPRPELHDLYRTLAQCVSLADAPGDADLVAFTDLLTAILHGPVNADTYAALIGEGLSLWKEAESAHRLDWLLDTLETLAIHAAPAPEARTRFLAVAAGAFTRYQNRATHDQVDLLQALGSELESAAVVATLTPPQADERDEDPYAPLAGLRIAIYTLEKAAAARVQDTLADRCPEARVDLAHDAVCTSSLKALARGANLFVVATGSATHSATDCIAQHHPERPLYPNGKGSASILASLREYAHHRH